jgi:glutamate-5-semialdehyde dehydrogenase
VLRRLVALLRDRREELMKANAVDVQLAKDADVAPALIQRLGLTPAKLGALEAGIDQLAAVPDPLGRVRRCTELDEGLVLSQVTSPIGVLLIIFESRPDAVIQIGSLALRSGNAVLLKGGSEARHSNRILTECLRDALRGEDLPVDSVVGIEGRKAVQELLACDEEIDLVIPRGSGELVRSIQNSTRIPVLGHAEGICHLYLDAAADPSMAKEVTIDSKCNYPSACNTIETLLVHREFLPHLPAVIDRLREEGVEIRGDEEIVGCVPGVGPVEDSDWSTEYSGPVISVGVVDSLDQAIDHIHRYGSAHTEAIVTEDPETASAFLDRVDAAAVFVNASTRFADGYRFGLGAEVGISTGRIHARGPVGIDGLLTTRWLLTGTGHVVADYSSGKRSFIHRALEESD